jgi:hypothetical protein
LLIGAVIATILLTVKLNQNNAITTSTTTTISSTDGYFPSKEFIAIILDASIGLNTTQFNIEKNFSSYQLVTTNWTHFERLTIAEYGGDRNYSGLTFGELNSLDDYRRNIDKYPYYGEKLPCFSW